MVLGGPECIHGRPSSPELFLVSVTCRFPVSEDRSNRNRVATEDTSARSPTVRFPSLFLGPGAPRGSGHRGSSVHGRWDRYFV